MAVVKSNLISLVGVILSGNKSILVFLSLLIISNRLISADNAQQYFPIDLSILLSYPTLYFLLPFYFSH